MNDLRTKKKDMELKDKILEKVRGYYLRGLNTKEIGKCRGVVTVIQRWQRNYR
jgi:hypothetical protein